jgi:hypothetical protein
MQYINPIEILQLSNMADSSQIDSDTIKKANAPIRQWALRLLRTSTFKR